MHCNNLANNQANHKGKIYIKWGEKICSLLGKLLNVSNQGRFGFVWIQDVDGLLEPAQNAEQKQLLPLSEVSEVMDGSSWLHKACARHGWILWEGEEWFIDLVFPMKVLMASDGQVLSMDSASSPAKLDWLYWTNFIPIGAGKCLQDTAPGAVML